MSNLAWGLIAHSHEAQQQQLVSVLQNMGLTTHSADQLSDLIHLQVPLGSIWVIFDTQGAQSSIDQAYIEQLRQQQASVFWGILVLGQSQEQQKQNWIDVGADAYLSYPFDRNTLVKQLQHIIDQRTPLSYYNILPTPLANALDKMSLKLSMLNYYEILEVHPQVGTQELQQRFSFHQFHCPK